MWHYAPRYATALPLACTLAYYRIACNVRIGSDARTVVVEGVVFR